MISTIKTKLFSDTLRKTVTLLMALFCHYHLWNVIVNTGQVNFTFCLWNENKIMRREIAEAFKGIFEISQNANRS